MNVIPMIVFTGLIALTGLYLFRRAAHSRTVVGFAIRIIVGLGSFFVSMITQLGLINQFSENGTLLTVVFWMVMFGICIYKFLNSHMLIRRFY